MRWFVGGLLSLFIFSFTISPAEAHFRGQPFVKIDGQSTKIYTSQEFATIGDLQIPSDLAPGKYLPNQEITFEIDVSVLPFPEDVTKNAKYKWDFGDGTKVEGAKVTHKYSKVGPYVVNTEIEYGDLSKFGIDDPSSLPPTYQLIQLNVLPDVNYKTPNPVILINGKELKSYQRQLNGAFLPASGAFLELFDHIGGIRIAKNISFDASQSNGSSKITEYIWHFDDNDSLVKTAKTNHSYTNGYYLNNIGMRITDEKGFYADIFFDVGNQDMEQQKAGEEKDESPILSWTLIYPIVGSIGISLVIIIFIIWKIFSRKKQTKDEE